MAVLILWYNRARTFSLAYNYNFLGIKDIANDMGDNLEKSGKEIGSNIDSGIKEVGIVLIQVLNQFRKYLGGNFEN